MVLTANFLVFFAVPIMSERKEMNVVRLVAEVEVEVSNFENKNGGRGCRQASSEVADGGDHALTRDSAGMHCTPNTQYVPGMYLGISAFKVPGNTHFVAR